MYYIYLKYQLIYKYKLGF